MNSRQQHRKNLGLRIARHFNFNLFQETGDIAFQNGKFILKAGIENGVRVRRERKYPFLLARENFGPDVKSVKRTHLAELIVAHETPQETGVRGRQTRLGEDDELGQRLDIDSEFAGVVNVGRKKRIERVDSLEDYDRAFWKFRRNG